MDVPYSTSITALQSLKERMRGKLNGSLKAVKLQTSLAAKIKTKTLNNSSILKVSLKHNNKALARALTVEKEKSSRLGNDIMFLQKEVKMLHFQNALLRQNLSIVNKMLKDIDVFMNINLPAAIEISSTMESSDRLSLNETKSQRFSQQSALSTDEYQGFRLTGVALRVPSNSVGQVKRNSRQPIVVNEENRLIVPPSPLTTVVRENRDKLDEPELHTLNLSSKEQLSEFNENASRDSLSGKVKDSLLPLDEVFSSSNRKAQSGEFVTKRKKRCMLSHSSTGSMKSETNQTMSSMGMSQESSPSAQWEMGTDVIIFPDLERKDFGGAKSSYIDSVLQKDRLSTTSHCSSLSKKLDTDQGNDAGKDISNVLYEGTNELKLVQNGESDQHTVDGHVEQEKTVYEADMEMTSSESSTIISVLSKNKKQASKNKSGIPVKQTGTLRKVKKSVREKTKRAASSVEQQVDESSNSNEKGATADKFHESLTSDRHDDRRTYVLPGPVVQEGLDVFESRTQSKPEVSVSGESCVTGQIVLDETIVLNGEKSKLAFTVVKDHWTEAGNIADVAPKKRRSKNVKEASHVECSRKKKRKTRGNSKDQEQMVEENDNIKESTDRSKKINIMPNIHVNHQEQKIRRETYVVDSSTKQHPVANERISKAHGVKYRRETFVVSEPNPLVSVTLKMSNNTFVEPENDVKSLVPVKVYRKTKNRPDTKKSDSENKNCNAVSDLNDTSDCKKHVTRCSGKKASSDLFSEFDKRKTHILPGKQDDFKGEKATLARESFINLPSSQRDKARKIPNVTTNLNDSFTLDMVSESILENTTELSSFAEFPSATNSRSTSLKSFPSSERPVSEDCNKELSHDLNNVLEENYDDHQQEPHKTEIGSLRQCKVEDLSVEIYEPAIKTFEDLTNQNVDATKQSPKSCSEEESHGQARRRRNPVNYKEPNLGTKLRREDSSKHTALRCSAIKKGKGKQGGGRKKKVKTEECGTEDT
ncbi:shugoshin 2 [Rhinoderma darwinii]|uniref:shugoshin 2 n=1 Tax=Rhinoderma darwinii TaxID=43563 RepID=UPI003F662DA9